LLQAEVDGFPYVSNVPWRRKDHAMAFPDRLPDTLPADGGIVEVEMIFFDTWVLESGTYVSWGEESHVSLLTDINISSTIWFHALLRGEEIAPHVDNYFRHPILRQQ
jgi:hypothetical protein